MTLDFSGEAVDGDAAVGGFKMHIAIEAGEVDAAVHGVEVGSQMLRDVEVVVDAVAGAVEEVHMRAVVAQVAIVGVDDDLVEEIVGLGFGGRPGGDAGFEGDVGAVFAGDVDAAIGGADGEVAGGEGKSGAAHLADVGFAPVVAVVVAVAVMPVAGLLRGGGANIAARMGEGHAEDDEGGEADDEQTEAAHGADLAGWIRGWVHNCSL